MFTIGIDVGGTTRIGRIDRERTHSCSRMPSTPADQSIGVMAGWKSGRR